MTFSETFLTSVLLVQSVLFCLWSKHVQKEIRTLEGLLEWQKTISRELLDELLKHTKPASFAESLSRTATPKQFGESLKQGDVLKELGK
jgi:hypothetical protein